MLFCHFNFIGIFYNMKKTKRLMFESLVSSHSKDLFTVMNNQNIFKYVDESPYTNKDKLFKRYVFLSKGAPPESNQEWLNWAIKLKNSNDYIGLLQATIYKNQKTEIGYLLSPKYWSNGYGTEAVNYLCEYLFKNKNVKKIIASIDTRNLISIKLVENLHFKYIKTIDCTLKNIPAKDKIYQLNL